MATDRAAAPLTGCCSFEFTLDASAPAFSAGAEFHRALSAAPAVLMNERAVRMVMRRFRMAAIDRHSEHPSAFGEEFEFGR